MSLKTHTLLIHQAFAGPNEPGGTRHYEFGSRLVQHGHAISVIASNINYLTGEQYKQKKCFTTIEDLDGIRVLRAYTYPSLHRSFVWRIIAFFSFCFTSIIAGLRAGNVDLVMGTTPPIFQAVSAWAVAFLRRRPFLLEVRDLWPEFAIDMGVLKNPILVRLSRLLETFIYARATHLLVNSPAYRDYLIAKGIAPEKITLIANGADVKAFSPTIVAGEFRQELGLNRQYIVTYAGALGMANDIPVLVEAAERLRERKEIHFLIVGDGKERFNLESLVREKRLQNITFLGARPKSEMPQIIAASDACLAILKNIPMFTTTYPNKVFDYMAAGRPTVLAIDGVIRKVMEDARGGIFVTPGDAEALAEAIDRLSRDPQMGIEMGHAARKFVETEFNRDQQFLDFMGLVMRFAKTQTGSSIESTKSV
jgi:glycosyltransferase involved in cell wall biosynthesis